ncbi:hypothetical protein ENBRE01_0753 [Enteropsectra breve]|nr:hypothetical protein ENBRE01_0753 [Enteropsectra breve]
MEMILKIYPQFKARAELFKRIETGAILENIPGIDSFLDVIKIETLKKLLKTKFHNSPELKDAIKHVSKYETQGIERMVYRVLGNKEVGFDDLQTKIMFYRALPEFAHLLINKAQDKEMQYADKYYKILYMNDKIEDSFYQQLEELHIDERAFYFTIFGKYHSVAKIHQFSNSITKDFEINSKIGLKLAILKLLTDQEFYPILSSYMLFLSNEKRIAIIRAVDGTVDYHSLAQAMLDECFSAKPSAINKLYIVFLKVIELFTLEYSFKLNLLYAWLRFFLYTHREEEFRVLYENISKAKDHGSEFLLHTEFYKLMQWDASVCEIEALAKKIELTNSVAQISFDEIFDQYR